MQYTIVKEEGETHVTAFITGRDPLMVTSAHPSFDEILKKILADDETVVDLIDATQAVADRFESLSERIAVRHGHIYFDGDQVDNALTKQVLRFLGEGVEDWKPLVAFWEKLTANPVQHSQEQLFKFLDKNRITITEDGDIVAFKGVRRDKGNVYRSTTAGHAIVNGEDVIGFVPNAIGDVIEMPRAEVAANPAATCSAGLHIATYGFAQGYGNHVFEVHVNPRDVVSVPNEAGAEKVRVCRYRVIADADGPIKTPVKVIGTKSESEAAPELPVEPVVEKPTGTPPPDLRAPSKKRFDEMLNRAKKRRQNVIKYFGKMTDWSFIGGDPKDRKNWTVKP